MTDEECQEAIMPQDCLYGIRCLKDAVRHPAARPPTSRSRPFFEHHHSYLEYTAGPTGVWLLMAPTLSPIPRAGDSGAQSALSTVQPFISRNPAVFYAVVVLCSLSLACGAVYLSGAILGAWKFKGLGNPRKSSTSRASSLDGGTANIDMRSRIKCLWLKLNGEDPRKVRSPIALR